MKLHLVTDAGFVRTTVLCFAVEVAVLFAAYSYPPLRYWANETYEEVKLKMLGAAHSMAWWSLLGLLSSSCCVLQIILNAFSFGCAGFNTLLGPVRPPCIAFTFIAQGVSWYVPPHHCSTQRLLLLSELTHLLMQVRGVSASFSMGAHSGDNSRFSLAHLCSRTDLHL